MTGPCWLTDCSYLSGDVATGDQLVNVTVPAMARFLEIVNFY